MNNFDGMNQKSNMIIYTTEDGLTKIETTFDEDTVWLSKALMAELFQRVRSVISKHIKNVDAEGIETISQMRYGKNYWTALKEYGIMG